MKKFVAGMGLILFASQAGWAADEEANKKILKDALVGAMTGAVAVEATKEEVEAVVEADKETGKKKNFGWKKKHKKRPHGWDMGKKTGWGEGDEPPGLAKKKGKI